MTTRVELTRQAAAVRLVGDTVFVVRCEWGGARYCPAKLVGYGSARSRGGNPVRIVALYPPAAGSPRVTTYADVDL